MAQIIKKENQPEEKVEIKEKEVLAEEVQNDRILEETTEVKEENIPEVKELDKVLLPTKEQREIDALKADNKAKDEKINELSQMMEKMQAQMDAFMKGAIGNSSLSSKQDSEDVLVGCRCIYGAVLATSDDRLSFKFECDEEKYMNSDDLKELFRDSKRNVKGNFENDIFYFVDDKYYKEFKIKKRVDLSPDNIARILCLPSWEMIEEFNALTNNKLNFPLMHEFQYQVVKMLVKNDKRLSNWSYDNRHKLEEYIGQKFDNLLASVGALELLGRKKYNK